MNHYLSNLLFHCFHQHIGLLFITIFVSEEFLEELLNKNILSLDEFTFLSAKKSPGVSNEFLVQFLLRTLRASLSLVKFFEFLKNSPDTPVSDYGYLVMRITSTIRNFEEIAHFA